MKGTYLKSPLLAIIPRGLERGDTDPLSRHDAGPPGMRPAILARMGQVILRDPAPTLTGIQTPTLLLWSEQDAMIPISNAADYLRYIPHARLVSLPNLGHVPSEEHPVKSLAPVDLFLSGVTP